MKPHVPHAFRFIVAFLFILSVLPTPVFAQEERMEEDVPPDMIETTTPLITTTVLVGAGLALSVIGLGVSTTNSGSNDAGTTEEVLAVYLEQNRVAVQHDLFVGGGDALGDLAILLGFTDDQVSGFSKVLFAHRLVLADLLNLEQNSLRVARELIRIVRSEMQS